jgi:type II secretory pathway component PulF
MGETLGVLKKSGAWLLYGEEKLGQGKENARVYLKENPRILAKIEKEIVEGADLSDALKRSRVLPPSLGFIAGVGEESGELARVLREVADGYTEEVEIASGRMTDLLNPILIVVLGVMVGFIVAAILLPITDFSSIQK